MVESADTIGRSERARVAAVTTAVVAIVIGLVGPSATAQANDAAVHWTQMNPATSPSARYEATLAYDAAHQKVVLFGGANSSGSSNETWLWNGTNWLQKHPAHSPPARSYQFMAYDSTHHYVILFGGIGGPGWLGDTWTWDGTDWTEQHPATSPAPRSTYGGMSNDPDVGGVVLYGGYDQTNLYFDTWKWTGSNWVQITTTAHPSGYIPALAYSKGLGGVISFADGGNQTWLFDGSDWSIQFPATSPPGRYEAGLASVGQGDALFGGGYGGAFFHDTWYFNGSNWAILSGASPPARGYLGMTYDAARGKVVMFGGLDETGTYFGDTWTLGP